MAKDYKGNECYGFHWIGQPLTSCDACGEPAWEHDYENTVKRDADPFSDIGMKDRPWSKEMISLFMERDYITRERAMHLLSITEVRNDHS